ncbi:hypothetical protein ACFQ58_11815 [Agromyces sp. NPDC056523]|uniref:hypothetical protein n=1 Tax=Agromyces sp. NPDC056523 TaxID=3345850 RepID=UPI00366F995D
MAAAPRPRFRSARSRQVASAVLLSVLAVVTLAAVGLALSVNRVVPEAGATPGAVAPPTESLEPAPSAEPSAEPTAPSPAPAGVGASRVLTAIDASSAIRATASTCPEPTTVEVTTDGGATWAPIAAATVSAAQWVGWDGEAFVSVLGLAAEGCGPVYEQSWTSGAEWESAPGELAASWYVDPANPATLLTPAGELSAPCGAVEQLAAVDADSAALLCTDDTVHATIDGGATWLAAAGPLIGAAAISAAADGYHVVLVDQGGCVGAQLATVTLAAGVAQVGVAGGCLDAAVPAGAVAVGIGDDGSMWVWAGDRVGISTDGGSSWL